MSFSIYQDTVKDIQNQVPIEGGVQKCLEGLLSLVSRHSGECNTSTFCDIQNILTCRERVFVVLAIDWDKEVRKA